MVNQFTATPDTDPNEFTDREKFLLSYYRSRQLSGSRPALRSYWWVIVASVACVVLAAVRGDTAFGFVGYALLLGLVYFLVSEGGRWSKDLQSIFAKYDARLKTLADAKQHP